MSPPGVFLSTERVRLAVTQLAEFATTCRYDDLPVSVRRRMPLVLVDLAGVTVAGMRTPELRSLVEAWGCPPGDTAVPGTSTRTTPETSAYLAAVAACCLELDEGNKHAAGHPAAHVVFAATAAARTATHPVSGQGFLTALALGYEVAARFGRATRRDPTWHPHGNWGATGAACAAALILGGTSEQVAAAIDASTGLMHLTPWPVVLDGDFTRNLWIAGANTAGLTAARLSLAGLVDNPGTAHHTLGGMLGELDPELLVTGLGGRWLAAEGYVKQHSACSYTHPAVDLVLALRAGQLRAGHSWDVAALSAVKVRVHSLARPLLRRHPRNRLAAMFSLPFVVSTAVVSGVVDPVSMQPGSPAFVAAEEFSARVEVDLDARLDAHLPDLRCTEVRLEFIDGGFLHLGAPNPVGDADHFPLDEDAVAAKIVSLVGAADATKIIGAVAGMARASDVRPALAALELDRRQP